MSRSIMKSIIRWLIKPQEINPSLDRILHIEDDFYPKKLQSNELIRYYLAQV